jgi:hypothetical protein
MIDKPEARRFPPPWSVNYPDSNSGSVSSLTCAVAQGVFTDRHPLVKGSSLGDRR